MSDIKLKTCVLSMIRNDADIIENFLDHCLHLFDGIYIIDVNSTDGSSEILIKYENDHGKINLYHINIQEKYQSAMMNSFALKASQENYDWIFMLDADEFLNVTTKVELGEKLSKVKQNYIHMPWINLIPSEYGDFMNFQMDQKFYWSGRVSKYNKIAVSTKYLHKNPKFYIHEGNHDISPDYESAVEDVNYHLSILHLPIRSHARLKYKIDNAWRTLMTKVNRLASEGSHVIKIKELMDGGHMEQEEINYLAMQYGDYEQRIRRVNPTELNLPEMTINQFEKKYDFELELRRTEEQTLREDAAKTWMKAKVIEGEKIVAIVDQSNNIKILVPPTQGNGEIKRGLFSRLDDVNENISKEIEINEAIKAMEISFHKIEDMPFSAWSELVPALFSIFAFMKPRRYVELGSHYGLSFFAACQASPNTQSKTQCIAIDSWEGDEHAGYHSNEVFDSFKKVMTEKHPLQYYIKGYFSDALNFFEDKSIDLLHIDGFHTYEAVKEDFETWLPKLSNDGVILFHDINVYERGFGVWRLWRELTKMYPSFHFNHMHGLGILYVGSSQNAVSRLFHLLREKDHLSIFLQDYFQLIGKLSVTSRTLELKNMNLQPENVILRTNFESSTRENLALIRSNEALRGENFEKNQAIEYQKIETLKVCSEYERAMFENQMMEIKVKNILQSQEETSLKKQQIESENSQLKANIEMTHNENVRLNQQIQLIENENQRLREESVRIRSGMVEKLINETSEKDHNLKNYLPEKSRSGIDSNDLLSNAAKQAITSWVNNKTSSRGLFSKSFSYFSARISARYIRESKMFDEKYYMEKYSDVKESGVNPIFHFAMYGVCELRNPNPNFNTQIYLIENTDVLLSGVNPFVHYLRFGAKENRKCN